MKTLKCDVCGSDFPLTCEQASCISLYGECMLCRYGKTAVEKNSFGIETVRLPSEEIAAIQAITSRRIIQYQQITVDCPKAGHPEHGKDCSWCHGDGFTQAKPSPALLRSCKETVAEYENRLTN